MIKNLLIYLICSLSLSACDSEKVDKYQRNAFLTHLIDEKYDKLTFYQKHIPEKAGIASKLAQKIKGTSDTCYLMLSYYSSPQILSYLKKQEKYFPARIKGTISTAIEDMNQFNHELNAERIQILESEVLSQVIDFMFQTDLKLIDEFAVIPRAKSNVLQYGDTYLADVFLVGRCSTCPATIKINEKNWKDTLTFDRSTLPHLKIDKDKYQRGMNELKPKYILKTEDGEMEVEFNVEFEVK